MAAAAHMRRLSETLDGPVTLGELSARLGREGAGLLAFLCALPFLQPIPLAGLGTPVGLMIIAVGIQLAQGKEAPAPPRFVASRRLEAATVKRLLASAETILGAAESFARPRWRGLARSPRLFGGALVLLGVILAVPVFVPLGNPITGAPLALIGLALLEEDGLLGAAGLAGTLLTIAYHAAFARLIWSGAKILAAKLA
jgi:hypothetical protein